MEFLAILSAIGLNCYSRPRVFLWGVAYQKKKDIDLAPEDKLQRYSQTKIFRHDLQSTLQVVLVLLHYQCSK